MLMARWLTRWTGLLLVHAAEANITGTWSDSELLSELPRPEFAVRRMSVIER